jgi:hypothetical protein
MVLRNVENFESLLWYNVFIYKSNTTTILWTSDQETTDKKWVIYYVVSVLNIQYRCDYTSFEES